MIASGGGDTLGFAGGSDVKRLGRQADIGGQSPRKNKFLLLLWKVSMGFDQYSHCPFLIREVNRNSLKQKTAFTLAEVLITLGIIGVVAALIIPSIVGKYQRKVLESQFKKTVSVVSQAVLMAKQEMGLDKFADYCVSYNETSYVYVNRSECSEVLYNSLLSAYGKNMNLSQNRKRYLVHREPDTIKTYNGKQTLTSSGLAAAGSSIFDTYAMPDGSFINFYIIERVFQIAVDVNGLKGPNKFGHDIFILYINSKNDAVYYRSKPDNSLTDEDIQNGIDDGTYKEDWQAQRAGYPCSLTSNQRANGIGCIYYALIDKCPYDSSKRYFECLP